MPWQWRIQDGRTAEQILEHYEIEKRLAARLREANRWERRRLYGSLYDELFERVPHHPQLTNRRRPDERNAGIARQAKFLSSLCGPEATYLEVGPGDCMLAIAMTSRVATVYAIDVSDEITRALRTPENFHLILSDGTSVDVPEGSIDLAFSNQLMEHLHPEDAFDQLRNIYRALKPGGKYFCITPNRVSGPHDVSRAFDDVAKGFHLREYDMTELAEIFRRAGFSGMRSFIGLDGTYLRVPMCLVRAVEAALKNLPGNLRKSVASLAPFRLLLGIRLLATK